MSNVKLLSTTEMYEQHLK